MSILDKAYKLIHIDLIEKIFNDINIIFSISDNETSDFYLKITKNLVDINLEKFSVTLWIKKPDGTTVSKTIAQNEQGLFYCNLENKYKNQIGSYKVQAFVEDSETFERVATLGIFSYEVVNDILAQQKEPEASTGKLEVTYNETDKTLAFDCDANYNSEKNTVEVN